jgi:N-acetylglucosaminyl-diphospho-decaprenol L-rhamnosyltransferase
VVNYGSHHLLDANLGELARHTPGTDVVIVDNFSGDTERDAISCLAADRGWQLVTPSANEGFGKAVNLGVDRAMLGGCDVYVIVNPDVEIAPSTVVELTDRVRADPMTMRSPRLLLPSGAVWFAGGQIDLETGLTTSRPDDRQCGRQRWLSGACLAVHRDLWQRLGGFDPEYFLYWEDVDLSQRCLSLGGDLRVEHDLTAVHSVGATHQSGSAKSGLYNYFNCRNRLLFARRHVSPTTRLRWLRATPRFCVRVVRRTPTAALVRRPSLVIRAFAGAAVGSWWVISSILKDSGVARRNRRPH